MFRFVVLIFGSGEGSHSIHLLTDGANFVDGYDDMMICLYFGPEACNKCAALVFQLWWVSAERDSRTVKICAVQWSQLRSVGIM